MNSSEEFIKILEYAGKVTPYIASGLGVVIKLYIVVIICSIPLGLICAIGKVSKSNIIKGILEIYTWVFRGTPLLLQLFFVYFGLSKVFGFNQFQAAAVTFIINYGAYFTEIFRAGIQSIDKGQYEAAKALGMNYSQTMKRIIIPQMLKRVLPPISNEAITLVKDTSLVTAIAIGDILRNAKEIASRDFTLTPYIIAGIMYLALTSVIVYIFKKLEQRYSVYE